MTELLADPAVVTYMHPTHTWCTVYAASRRHHLHKKEGSADTRSSTEQPHHGALGDRVQTQKAMASAHGKHPGWASLQGQRREEGQSAEEGKHMEEEEGQCREE